MYGNARYSLTRYSVNQANRTLAVEVRLSESLGALVGAAVPVSKRVRLAETMRGSIRGAVSIMSAFSAQDSLGAAVRLSANVLSTAALADSLQGSVYLQKDVPVSLEAMETLSANTWVSKDIPADTGLAEQLSARVIGSKNIPSAFLAAEVLTTSFDATSQTTERTTLHLTIPPGGELRIDSELFTVLLNGENALHTQSGDWISLSREVLRLNIESATGGDLEGQMIYTERYL